MKKTQSPHEKNWVGKVIYLHTGTNEQMNSINHYAYYNNNNNYYYFDVNLPNLLYQLLV
jgi:hypothetical protein